ncbi:MULTISPECIES: MBL fold metallo-hydrolase [unclassified Halanaerobium]|uniref:MBL fold metallo-hydrolase n=1 Tax=unclassified Halanaerobium TaxID=2641197 RepID=UPI000DF30C78|nr:MULTISPECIES: MBL fold metallo-hydrolase [unclassified Halanaerobium]RCW43791.1 glyoxylase-like metal-dependent hydrolase (beta-lactamase superfamily II) [Halanaerobium sp. MA284_MarDTE_T2]RCW80215.1 glyoxylase-like metal-dependent hydrolase (beta-lactamase superfamily II) [Halanaerobium sp. DL-01]
MKIKTMALGTMFTKSYIISDSHDNAYIIDPGDDGKKVLAFLNKKSLHLKFIINTHGHFDHIGANEFLKQKTAAEIIIHKKDNELLTDPAKNMSGYFYSSRKITSPPADKFIADGDILTFDKFKFKVLHTPGHTAGSMSFYCSEEKILFSGDTIFSNGIGRTDLPGANQQALKNSIENKLLTLPDDTVVYPGHGNSLKLKSFKTNIWPSIYSSLT